MGRSLHASSVNLILFHPNEVDAEGRVVLSDDRAWHIRKVLRSEVGQKLRVGVLNGALGQGTIESMDGEAVALTCAFEAEPPPRPRIDLLLAMPRPKVLKRLWAQFAALGVGRIVLVRAEKVERYYFDSHVIEPDFYTKHLIEGLQQARDTWLPEVIVKPLFKPFMEDEFAELFRTHRKLLADPSGRARINELVGTSDERVVLAIGPEGGWTPYELDMLKERGFELFGMGDRVLRSDTATIGLLSILNERLAGA